MAELKNEKERILDAVKMVIRTVFDPEIPVNIYDLGLIYEIDISDDGVAYVKMTLTSPMCPVAEIMPAEVEAKVRCVQGITKINLDLVWDPPWHPDMMTEAARSIRTCRRGRWLRPEPPPLSSTCPSPQPSRVSVFQSPSGSPCVLRRSTMLSTER